MSNRPEKPNALQVAIPATRVAYLVVNVLWILNCAVNPLAFFVHDLPVEGILKVICGYVTFAQRTPLALKFQKSVPQDQYTHNSQPHGIGRQHASHEQRKRLAAMAVEEEACDCGHRRSGGPKRFRPDSHYLPEAQGGPACGAVLHQSQDCLSNLKLIVLNVRSSECSKPV